MQINDPSAACLLMQPVYILRNNLFDMAFMFKLGENPVGDAGLSVPDDRPADEASRPIALANLLIRHKMLMLDRLLVLPFAVCIPVGRNAGLCTNSCTG